MYSINNLKMMEVIDVTCGRKLGYIRDLRVDCEAYKIISIVLPIQKTSWFSRGDFFEIPWESIKKIGQDVVLVDFREDNEKDSRKIPFF